MERRKLFSAKQEEPKKRKLFSDFAITKRRKLFCSDSPESTEATPEEIESGLVETKVLVCQDCGYQLNTKGDTCDCVCPNCGSRRFNFLQDMSAPIGPAGPGIDQENSDQAIQEAVNEVDKAFSEIREETRERRKLFSALTNIQPNTNGEGADDPMGTEHPFECSDCCHTFMDESETPSGVRCPNCGGNRVVQVDSDDSDQREFSDTSDETDEFLKEFSGKTIGPDELQKIFSERGINETIESMISSGYARETEDGQVCFSECSDIQRKLFSKLVISVTKELDLDPVESKEALIHKLIESDNLPDRSIMLIKRAHNMPIQNEFSDNSDEYIKDSGIENDLRLEYGGTMIPLKEFMSILNEQYNDAPENILDQLVSANVIKISGSQVEILK